MKKEDFFNNWTRSGNGPRLIKQGNNSSRSTEQFQQSLHHWSHEVEPINKDRQQEGNCLGKGSAGDIGQRSQEIIQDDDVTQWRYLYCRSLPVLLLHELN